MSTSSPDRPEPVTLDLSSMFSTPRINTDSDGIHRDQHGREYRLVAVDGEITFEPFEPVATWSALSWAAESWDGDAGLIHHTWTHPAVISIPGTLEGGPAFEFQVEVGQSDEIDAGAGRVVVTRRDPEVFVECLILSLPMALKLADALVSAVAHVDPGAPEFLPRREDSAPRVGDPDASTGRRFVSPDAGGHAPAMSSDGAELGPVSA